MTEDPLKKKLADLETRLSKLTTLFFAYHLAMLKCLKDKGVADPKEFGKYLSAAKKEYKQLHDDVEFLKMMKQFKKKEK